MSDNPEDHELLHYGVKGMKWGVRRAEKKAARKAYDEETTSARERQVSRSVKVEKKQIEAIDAFLSGKQKMSDKLMDEAKNLQIEMLNHPDQKIANRMTTGEKRVRKINTAVVMTSVGLAAAASIALDR